jgi:hypothetical protein
MEHSWTLLQYKLYEKLPLLNRRIRVMVKNIIILILVILNIYILFNKIIEESKYPSYNPGTAPSIFKEAHNYHGILHSQWSEEKQKFIFIRNNKECSLFTKSFWDYYSEKHNKRKE